MKSDCPLCGAPGAGAFHRDQRRDYRRCEACALVFVPPAQRLSREEEHAEYLLHDNRVDDPGYRRFLARLADPLDARLPARARGLDFGCGPAPALARLLEERGHRLALHDSFFCPDEAVFERCYDFITATEVVEHLHRPGVVLEALWQCLEEGGLLGIMTKLVRNRDAFARWHYIRDPTHVCFFSRDTWRWWSERYAADLQILGEDVILLRKPGGQCGAGDGWGEGEGPVAPSSR